jgi:hypothetical protein
MLEIEVIIELIRTLYNHAHPTFKMNFGCKLTLLSRFQPDWEERF